MVGMQDVFCCLMIQESDSRRTRDEAHKLNRCLPGINDSADETHWFCYSGDDDDGRCVIGSKTSTDKLVAGLRLIVQRRD